MADLITQPKKESKKLKIKEIKKPSFWTKEEDNILMEKAQEYHYKNWNSIAEFIPGRTSIQCSARYRRIRPGIIKGAWDKEEDKKLLILYEKYGKNWAAISKEMPQRTGKQIRDRYLNSLDSKFERGKFTEEEDQAIIKYYKIYGNSWAKIAKKLKTRTGDMVKNRFYSSLKKYVFKNKSFLRRKRENCSPITNVHKKIMSENKKNEIQNNKISSNNQKDSTNTENISNEKKEEEKEMSDLTDNIKGNIEENIDEEKEKNEIDVNADNMNNFMNNYDEQKNHINVENDSMEDSIDRSDKMDKMMEDNYENENTLKNNINNYNCFNLDENIKKNELNNELEFNDNNIYNYNSDLFALFGNNVNNNNNFYQLYNKNELDERLDKFKNCPKLELDYKQNLKEQLGIIFNLENIINQKLFSVQRQIGNN